MKPRLDESGAAIWLMLMVTVIAFVTVAYTLDAGRGNLLRRQLQSAADAAAVSAGRWHIYRVTEGLENSALNSDTEARAKRIWAHNLEAIGMDVLNSSGQLRSRYSRAISARVETVASLGKVLTVRATMPLDGLMMASAWRWFGKRNPANSMDISVTARYSLEIEKLAVVLSFDISASMSNQEVAAIKRAARKFVDELETGDYVAIRSFNATYDFVGRSNTNLALNMTEISNSGMTKSQIKSVINQNLSRFGNQGTQGQGALLQARRDFRDLSNQMNSAGYSKLHKYILFLSDGDLLFSAKFNPARKYDLSSSATCFGKKIEQLYSAAGKSVDGLNHGREYGWAASIEQADLARNEGVTIWSICTGASCNYKACGTDASCRNDRLRFNRVMARIAGDPRFKYDSDSSRSPWRKQTASRVSGICRAYNGLYNGTYDQRLFVVPMSGGAGQTAFDDRIKELARRLDRNRRGKLIQ